MFVLFDQINNYSKSPIRLTFSGSFLTFTNVRMGGINTVNSLHVLCVWSHQWFIRAQPIVMSTFFLCLCPGPCVSVSNFLCWCYGKSQV